MHERGERNEGGGWMARGRTSCWELAPVKVERKARGRAGMRQELGGAMPDLFACFRGGG